MNRRENGGKASIKTLWRERLSASLANEGLAAESDVDAEEHDIPVTIASTEEQETASEETSPEESALYEDSENVEEIATPESAQPASDSTIPLEESEYAQEVA